MKSAIVVGAFIVALFLTLAVPQASANPVILPPTPNPCATSGQSGCQPVWGGYGPLPSAGLSVAFAALPSATPPAPLAHTYYVNAATGSDYYNGLSTTAAFASLNKANSTMSGGDVVVVYPGTYNENLCLTKSGTSSNYTTWIAASGLPRPIVQEPYPGTGNCYGGVIGSYQVAYLRISGIAVTNPYQTSVAPSSYDINGCLVATGGSTTSPTNSHHHLFDFDETYNCGGSGIRTSHSDYETFTGNIVFGNANYNFNQSSGISLGFEVNYDSVSGYHETLTNNYSFNNRNYANTSGVIGSVGTTDGNGIILDTNSLYSFTGNFLVAGNLVFQNGGRGIEVNSTINADVFNNTAFGDCLDTLNTDYPGRFGEIETSSTPVTSVRIWNNIAQSSNSAGTTLYQSSSTDSSWENNVTYIGGWYSGGTAISPAANLLNSNPLFVDGTANLNLGNFSILHGSPAENYGQALAFNFTDLVGITTTAGNTLNAGAYSYQP